MDSKKIVGQTAARKIEVGSVRAVDKEERTVEVSFSSEAVVPMWYGLESLSHDTGAADLSRMADGGPVLMDHDEGQWVGAVQSIRIDQDRKGRAVVKFGENALARDVWPDVASGLRKFTSFRYRVLDAIRAETDTGEEYIKVTRWQPLEISFVSVPADASVGVGRSLKLTQYQQDTSMPEINNNTGGGTATKEAPAKQDNPPENVEQRNTQPAKDLSANVVITGGETQRTPAYKDGAEIRSLAIKHNALEQGLDFIANQRSAQDFKDLLLDRITANAEKSRSQSALGLSTGEQRSYSFMRAIRAAAYPNDKAAQDAAGFELECSRSVQQRYGQTEENSVSVPTEILMSPQAYNAIQRQSSRAFNVAAGPGAIDQGLRPQDFVELLRNKTLAFQLGVNFVSDVVGSPYVPRHTSSGTAGWIAEDGTATTTDAAIGQTQLVPKHISATSYLTRSFLIQDSIGMEGQLVNDLFTNIAIGIDKALFHGTGSSNQPTGLAAASIGSVAIGTNGGNMTKAKLHEFISDVEVANAYLETMAFVTTPGVKSF